MKRLLNIAKFCTFCLFCLLPMIAFGQTQGYTNTRTWSQADLTTQSTSGTVNAWVYVAGNPICKPKSLAQGYDLSAWCQGINDNLSYKFNPQTKQWDKHAEMGTNVVAMIVSNANNIYSMQTTGCPTHNGIQYYALFKWNGSQWTDLGGCATNYSIGIDGYMTAAGWDVNTNQAALFYSTDSGTTWTLWVDGWTYINMMDATYGCAIDVNNTIWYTIGVGQNSTAEPALPTGTPAGCVLTESDPVFIAWNNAGTVYLLNTTTLVWQAISGLTVSQVVAVDKGDVLGLSTTGKPYHWNVYAPTVTATITGTFDNFPMGGLNPRPKHTSHNRINFPHGTNTAPASTEVIDFAGNMNNSYSDTAPLCDFYYGGGGPECQPNVDVNDAACTIAGPLAVAVTTPSVSGGVSIQNVEWDGYISHSGPKLQVTSPTTGTWTGIVRSNIIDICAVTGGSPTCKESIAAHADVCFWEGDEIDSATCEGKVQIWMNNEILGDYFPYAEYTSYIRDGDFLKCFNPPAPLPYSGDTAIMLPCQ